MKEEDGEREREGKRETGTLNHVPIQSLASASQEQSNGHMHPECPGRPETLLQRPQNHKALHYCCTGADGLVSLLIHYHSLKQANAEPSPGSRNDIGHKLLGLLFDIMTY